MLPKFPKWRTHIHRYLCRRHIETVVRIIFNDRAWTASVDVFFFSECAVDRWRMWSFWMWTPTPWRVPSMTCTTCPVMWWDAHARTHTRALTFKSFSGFIVSLLLTCRKGSFSLLHLTSNLHKHTISCPPMYSQSDSSPHAHAKRKKKKTTTHAHAHTHAETCQSTALSPPNIINDCSTGSSDCGCLK